jgi:hypothetical protein
MKNGYFKTTAIFFVLVFVYYALKHGAALGVVMTAALWALSVVATPIPVGGVLLSFPIHVYTQFPMAHTQCIVSVLALFILWCWPTETVLGVEVPHKYILFSVCIASSVLLSHMINNMYRGIKVDRRLWIVLGACFSLYAVLIQQQVSAITAVTK